MNHINGHDDWATAPPIRQGQVFFTAMFCSRAVGSKGVTSPPMRILDYVQKQGALQFQIETSIKINHSNMTCLHHRV